MKWLKRLFGKVKETVEEVREDQYELVHMKANNRWYATVNGRPLKWDRVTGTYKEAYSWDYADSHSDKVWAKHMVDHHKAWKNQELFSKEKA